MHFLLTAAQGSPAHSFPLCVMYNVPQIPADNMQAQVILWKQPPQGERTPGRAYKLCDVGVVTESL